MKITFILIIFIINIQTRVIEITTNNIQLILKTTPYILLLFNNPECSHSKAYAKQFL
jgi:thioredoxin-related protein